MLCLFFESPSEHKKCATAVRTNRGCRKVFDEVIDNSVLISLVQYSLLSIPYTGESLTGVFLDLRSHRILVTGPLHSLLGGRF